jgi:hypothetical protein
MPARLLSSPRWPFGRRLALLAALLLVAASFSLGRFADSRLDLQPGRDRFNLATWEARYLPSKWLYKVGEVFRAGRSTEEQDADIDRFFRLTREITRLERQDPESAEVRGLRRERSRLENHVEATLEHRISEAIDILGITTDPPILSPLVWPPVDFELTDSPRSLVTSPRDRIVLLDSDLLRSDLSLEQVEKIEDQTQEEEDLSALAAPTSGVGAYPSIVDFLSTYESTVEVAAHEWVHNYLFFHPLGFNYYKNNDLRTMNETTADLVGHEIAEEVLRRWPVPEAGPGQPAASPEAAEDLGAELRNLRGEVDALLAAGRIEEAEALMETRRRELAARGHFIRKINQAYFAFNNLYAGEQGSPAATNPIGPKIDELRSRFASLKGFVEVMRGLTGVAELDEALATAPETPLP